LGASRVVAKVKMSKTEELELAKKTRIVQSSKPEIAAVDVIGIGEDTTVRIFFVDQKDYERFTAWLIGLDTKEGSPAILHGKTDDFEIEKRLDITLPVSVNLLRETA